MSSKNAIFISYRRSDSQDVTGRIYDRLNSYFDNELIFRDVYSIPYGNDFQKELKQSVERCEVLVAVIGATWLAVLQERLKRSDTDWVRTEIAMALQRDIPVIPLLVGGARMPGDHELPDDLQTLARRNAAQARPDPDFHNDIEQLIQRLEEIISNPTQPLSPLQQVKLAALKKRQQLLLAKFQAASNQMNTSLSEADKVTLQEQLASLEQELEQVANEISSITSS
ncbi:TIR domain-containing protein [Leptothoe sp. PORK10 BA2]|uniref:TIR domain-containing protein n=1 Tax=Leptothoe sp. PORK10 BA2 TaxID=3110254 RepID=UPI002B20B051|nr:TIR domain-containing protein [Leptothoe sp. PORK10 BA2]MEA5467021.1 TIR domain-containing protein [Leptothoe sp. PORK10 BA2]